jgi:hypothetical protein
MNPLPLNTNKRLHLLYALSYAKAWNDSLIDAHTIDGKIIDKPFVKKCEKQNKEFEKIHRELRLHATMRSLEARSIP